MIWDATFWLKNSNICNTQSKKNKWDIFDDFQTLWSTKARVKNAPSATPLIIPKISQASAVVAADDDVDKTGLKLRRFLFVALLTVVTLSVRQVRHEETISICDFVLDDNSCLLRLRVVSKRTRQLVKRPLSASYARWRWLAQNCGPILLWVQQIHHHRWSPIHSGLGYSPTRNGP